MSLINDALNRAKAEAARHEGESLEDVRPQRTIDPPRPARSPLREWLPVILVALIGIFVFWRLESRPVAQLSEDRVEEGIGEGVEENQVGDARPGPLAAAETVAAAERTTGTLPSAESRVLSPDSTPAGPRQRQSSIETPEPRGATTPVAVPVVAPVEASPRPSRDEPLEPTAVGGAGPDGEGTWFYVGQFDLPGGATIELGGILWSPTSPSAMLNGSLLSQGDQILGLTLSEISPRHVTLTGRDQTITLQLAPREGGE